MLACVCMLVDVDSQPRDNCYTNLNCKERRLTRVCTVRGADSAVLCVEIIIAFAGRQARYTRCSWRQSGLRRKDSTTTAAAAR